MKLSLRRILNLFLYLIFSVMIGTGLLMAYRLVPGNRGGQGLQVLGWSRHEWGDLHTWVSYVFVVLILAHLALSWAWLVKCAARGRVWRLAAGLLAGAAIIAALLLLPIERYRGDGGPEGKHKESQATAPAGTSVVLLEPPPISHSLNHPL